MRPRSLSAAEARVVLTLEEHEQQEVSLDEIERFAKVHRGYARKLAHGLVAKGWFHRLGRGRYLLNPSDYGASAGPESDPLRVGARLVHPYYFGYATAAELHGFLLQPGRTYYIVTPTRTAVHVSGPGRYRIVRRATRSFFGGTALHRRGERLLVSDPERTVLDCLDRPALAGGTAGAVQVFARAKPALDWRRLSSYLERLGHRSLALRVGFLAEEVRPSSPAPRWWTSRFAARSAEPWVPLGPPRLYGRTGRRAPRWHILVNVPARELLVEGVPP